MPPKTLENTIDLVKAVSSDTSGGLVFLFDNIKLGAKLSKSKPGKLQWRPFFCHLGCVVQGVTIHRERDR